jgi:hypothetical protein
LSKKVEAVPKPTNERAIAAADTVMVTRRRRFGSPMTWVGWLQSVSAVVTSRQSVRESRAMVARVAALWRMRTSRA